ncbi:MAG: exosome complex RNA-binding protein Rrp4 [Promethearchaeota archaeon]
MEIEEPDIDNEDDFEEGETTEREIVVPGEILSDDTENYLPGRSAIFNKEKNKIISLSIGLKQIRKNYINVIPLRGFYTPRSGDKVLGIVVDKNPVKYKIDINAKDLGHLKPKNTMKKEKGRFGRSSGGGGHHGRSDDRTEKYEIGDVLIVKVLSADRLNSPELTTVGKYLGQKMGGAVISIRPNSIPRVIGRNGSMIKMLKNMTNCNIFVTQNGRIWLKGDDIESEQLLIQTIDKIANEAHTVGLTDRIQEFLKTEKQKRGLN